MNHLYRHLAPITADTWESLDDEARTRLAPPLGGRTLVDFVGPLGWQYSASNVGRVTAGLDAPMDGISVSRRVVLPLVEVRADFTLLRSELDATARGAVDTDLSPLDTAAAKLATMENSAIFLGWDAAGIAGIVPSSPHEPLTQNDDPTHLAQLVGTAVETLARSGVGGPYGMAVDSANWAQVIGGNDTGGQSLRHHLERELGGSVVWTPGIDGAVVVSLRGGDFIFESGEDISLGYAAHTIDDVQLYLEESFSFRIATPEAAIAIS
ncbi:family 1 encapsulin nanocompartment shell protein [Microbacterium sp. P05]|uniref:family 1 encapsulin nanocompartment shell protein n=1 Tax=Microbacterium sp. P05 TaxID=3366948 RepID=UPI0037474010